MVHAAPQQRVVKNSGVLYAPDRILGVVQMAFAAYVSLAFVPTFVVQRMYPQAFRHQTGAFIRPVDLAMMFGTGVVLFLLGRGIYLERRWAFVVCFALAALRLVASLLFVVRFGLHDIWSTIFGFGPELAYALYMRLRLTNRLGPKVA